MLWLALYCPTLALDCLLRRWPDGIEPAMAVSDVDGTRRFIAATTRTAQACGVFAGQSVATALALLPDLLIVARKIDDERRALTDAALAALRFTPTVSLRASGLVMEISASVRLFGGHSALKKGIAAAMRVQGLRIAAAEAPTPHGAWLLAKEKARRRFEATQDALQPRRTPSQHRPAATEPGADPAAVTQGGTMPGPMPIAMPVRIPAAIKTSIPIQSAAPGRIDEHEATSASAPMPEPIASPTPVAAATSIPTSPSTRASTPTRFPPITFDAALDALPIAHLESLGPSARRMRGIGLFTLADLRRLPAKGLARRFGPALIDELARAAGDEPDPQVVFEAPSRFAARLELMARVESAEALVFASHRLLAQLSGWLTARRAAVRRFTLILHHDRWTRDAIEPTPFDIALATPSNDPVRLLSLVRERLSRLELKAPVLELALEAPVIVDEQEAHHTLFPEREQAAETLARLLEKLTARLGPDAMARIERVADHRPERAWRDVRVDLPEAQRMIGTTRAATRLTPTRPTRANDAAMKSRTKSSRARSAAVPDTDPDIGVPHRPITPGCSSGPRPAWLLSEPRRLDVRIDRPLYESLPLDLVAGPERIESGWWDDATVTRDYFIAENAAGHLVWIYRERLVSPDRRPTWYLQGLFA